MTVNKPMTGEQLDELMTIAVNMQRDSEKVSDRPAAMFAYAVQVAVLNCVISVLTWRRRLRILRRLNTHKPKSRTLMVYE
ncbi:hypothetical protein K1J20_09230 [Enterobacter hormaechei]|uniref:hypothetical protein n=1 Tax=Enterobacter TaxID=547 RepID=UPI00044C5F55|nr:MULTISPECIES: hypothetical protein [Enterobacter cloacae complex]EUM74181.1 hypothetical protein L356_08464 [Enterobacter sp. MGH 10]KAA0858912.1 hypothetical protein EYC85_02175 [Enterobacter hormaechei]KAA0871311.1 hypothetical protein EYC91_06020 [Enterobacter hormaechei]KAA0900357.1 hypothetical protein EVS72_18355 [Enterobacter hormaechei]KAA0907427.1 hypothetical protein EYC88_08645 [Enterobacter hormaechei]